MNVEGYIRILHMVEVKFDKIPPGGMNRDKTVIPKCGVMHILT